MTLKGSGSQAISATDSTNGAITGSASALVAAAAADHLSVVAPIITVAGVPFLVDATAQDSFGNIAGYRGTVHFTSSDSQAVLPPDYTFTATDAGQHSFLATLKTAGSRSVGATDTVAPTIAGTASILVLPGAATQFVLSAPTSAGAGVPLSLQVTVEDSFGNVTSGYRGTVHLSSGDGAATLQSDYPFSTLDAGSHAFTVTLRTAGVRSLAANDAALGVAGTTSVEVIPAAANKLAFHDQPANGAAGAIFQVTVEELDAFGNRETADSTTRVTVSLGGGPAEAALLGTLTQTAAGGLATFTDLSVQRAGTGYVLHATGGALTPDDSQAFAASPAELARIVAIPATAAITFGAGQSYTIEGFDRFGNSRGDVTSLPGVIPSRHHVDARGEDLLERFAGDPEPAGRVLPVGDREVHRKLAAKAREHLRQHPASRLSDDIPDKEDVHTRCALLYQYVGDGPPDPSPSRSDVAGECRYLAYSMARVSRKTVTLICPGYWSSSSILFAISRAIVTAVVSSISWGLTSTRISRPA